MKSEIWKPVLGWEGRYEVSNRGNVRSLMYAKGSKVLPREEPKLMTKHYQRGYPRVYLSKLNITMAYFVHRLVLEAFVGPAPKGKTDGAHLDGDPSNCNLTNLIWATRSENCKHKELHGTAQKGEKNPLARFTDEDILTMRQLRRQGWKLKEIGAKYNLAEGRVSVIVRGLAWPHLPK